jgi:hypothetical protein
VTRASVVLAELADEKAVANIIQAGAWDWAERSRMSRMRQKSSAWSPTSKTDKKGMTARVVVP